MGLPLLLVSLCPLPSWVDGWMGRWGSSARVSWYSTPSWNRWGCFSCSLAFERWCLLKRMKGKMEKQREGWWWCEQQLKGDVSVPKLRRLHLTGLFLPWMCSTVSSVVGLCKLRGRTWNHGCDNIKWISVPWPPRECSLSPFQSLGSKAN